MTIGTLIKVGDTWIDPARVDAIQPSRAWDYDTKPAGWVINSSSTCLSLGARVLEVNGVTPDEAAALINAAIAAQCKGR